MKENDKVWVNGDSVVLGIKDYNVRVDTLGTIIETPRKYAKKVLVSLDEIDGDHNVACLVYKSKIDLFKG